MSINAGSNQPDRKAEIGDMSFRSLTGIAGLTAALAAALFLSSGRLDWMMAWVYVGLRVAVGAASMLMIASKYPGLLDERFHPGEGVKAWDRPLESISTLLSLLTLVVAGLDIRFGWSPELAMAVRLVAFIIWLPGDVFSKWAAVSNRFYARIVRIQKDRGHTVVTEGPYRYVRHPGYAGALLAGLATPVALGSLWALAVGGVLAVLLAIRTALEDRALHEELPGYAEYAKQTPRRLVPGVW